VGGLAPSCLGLTRGGEVVGQARDVSGNRGNGWEGRMLWAARNSMLAVK